LKVGLFLLTGFLFFSPDAAAAFANLAISSRVGFSA
jgi:hypothetical protein